MRHSCGITKQVRPRRASPEEAHRESAERERIPLNEAKNPGEIETALSSIFTQETPTNHDPIQGGIEHARPFRRIAKGSLAKS